MGIERIRTSRYVIILTLLLAPGCSFINDHFQESCQSHAYTQINLLDYVSTRYIPNSPVRIGVIPASAPTNMSFRSNEQPGAGNELAWRIQQDLLNYSVLPIVEVLNREDWPGKKEEFYTGNFGAIREGRDAGYDLVVVTSIEQQRSMDEMSAYTKVIDTASGITVYYGKSTSYTKRDELHDIGIPFGITKREPSLIYTNNIVEKLGQCISQAIMKDK